jgi:hypothetical protein
VYQATTILEVATREKRERERESACVRTREKARILCRTWWGWRWWPPLSERCGNPRSVKMTKRD